MKIEILGAGCANCKKLEANVRSAVAQAEISAEIVKVQDSEQILAYGVIGTPAIVVDGAVKSAGRLLSPKEILPLLS